MTPQAARDKIVLLLINGVAAESAELVCVTQFGMSAQDAKDIVSDARRRITVAADYTRQEQIGTAVMRLNDLYSKSIAAKDVRVALQAQRELNRLYGLYGDSNEPQQPEQSEEGSGAASELEAVRGHLVPLGLAPAEYPVSEHARIAAAIVMSAQAMPPTQAPDLQSKVVGNDRSDQPGRCDPRPDTSETA